MKENCVERRMREVANNPIDTKLNLVQYKKEKIKALTHKEVCEKVCQYVDENPYMPWYGIMISGVGSNSFKNTEFDKGYKKFDKEKVDTIFKMSRAYMEKMGMEKMMPNDVVFHLCNKFYKNVSQNYTDFMSALAKAKVMEEPESRGCFQKLCENLGMW